MTKCMFLEGTSCRFFDAQGNWSGFLTDDPERIEQARQILQKLTGVNQVAVGISSLPVVIEMGLHLSDSNKFPDKRKASGKCMVSSFVKGQKGCKGYIEGVESETA